MDLPPVAGSTRERRKASAGRAAVAWQFRARARRYAALDSRLRTKTRFFGAACATNEVLSHLALCGRAPACADWLCRLGTQLESLNSAIAATVLRAPPGLITDERIVSYEQALVESAMQNARRNGSNSYAQLLLSLNALLNQSWIAAIHYDATVRWYWAVLRKVRLELAGQIDFARSTHRERVGMELIRALPP